MLVIKFAKESKETVLNAFIFKSTHHLPPTIHSNGSHHTTLTPLLLLPMSTFPFYTPPTPPPDPPSPTRPDITHIRLRYATVLSLAFLLILALILLCYLLFRISRRRPNPNPNFITTDNGITLPRSIFVDDEEADEQNGVVGLDQAVIDSYPKVKFVRGGDCGDSVCAICLCEYKEGEMLRMLPDCKHWFHLKCVDEWLKLNASCPVCRNSPLPTPLSTPLSEVVPLSLYTDGRNRRR
uniref:RING-type domain-containing protein n=1 Tax=Daucus carota subsp. sativus TaxID=79200 RepID=A0A166E5B9_DAUCS|nr:PREDICTED: RING-H2 finger protein ATL67-like [Daucus carota subsp. sativus]